jgi:hypothetical protein
MDNVNIDLINNDNNVVDNGNDDGF